MSTMISANRRGLRKKNEYPLKYMQNNHVTNVKSLLYIFFTLKIFNSICAYGNHYENFRIWCNNKDVLIIDHQPVV